MIAPTMIGWLMLCHNCPVIPYPSMEECIQVVVTHPAARCIPGNLPPDTFVNDMHELTPKRAIKHRQQRPSDK